jgi:hypothetical protein
VGYTLLAAPLRPPSLSPGEIFFALKRLSAVLVFSLSLSGSALAQESRALHPVPLAQKLSSPPLRELPWDTYLDKVQGAWMGKMIGVTFGQPWEFEYLGAPIGFDITDWMLSPTRMKDYRARSDNKTDYDEPIINEADNQKIHSNRQFIQTPEEEHPSFGAPDNDDI